MITGAYWSPSDKHTGYFALMQPPMPDPHTPSIRCLLLPRPYRMIRCFYRHLMPANLSCKVNSDHGPDDNSLSGYRCRDLFSKNVAIPILPVNLYKTLFLFSSPTTYPHHQHRQNAIVATISSRTIAALLLSINFPVAFCAPEFCALDPTSCSISSVRLDDLSAGGVSRWRINCDCCDSREVIQIRQSSPSQCAAHERAVRPTGEWRSRYLPTLTCSGQCSLCLLCQCDHLRQVSSLSQTIGASVQSAVRKAHRNTSTAPPSCSY
ncbi:hypothetical protein F4823DRAFT_232822 [Ustulina deusta]|nr:hypothetical protein F4823DRAFT_232822 [Ustulina deusta]